MYRCLDFVIGTLNLCHLLRLNVLYLHVYGHACITFDLHVRGHALLYIVLVQYADDKAVQAAIELFSALTVLSKKDQKRVTALSHWFRQFEVSCFGLY